ncbi:MAG: MarR family transcriptional regulator [Oscillospiraceae bacterium]
MNDYALIGKNILIIDKYFKIYFKNALKIYGLNASEGLALLMLYEGKCQTQDQIISELHYDKGVIARTMKELEDKGYVERNENPVDNRSFIFNVTEKSELVRPHIIRILKSWSDKLMDGIDDIEVLKMAITKMSINAYNTVKGDNE